MDDVEAKRIIEATLEAISRQHSIDLTALREAHRPILAALQEEAKAKSSVAENEGIERGRMESELRHLYLSELEFGRIGGGADSFDKAGVYSIIDSAIRLGGKFPRTLSLKKIRALQSELESCTSIVEVVALLENNSSLICNAFGVRDASIDKCILDIRSLDSAEEAADDNRAITRLNESLLLIAENGVHYEQRRSS
jgi:hypothetical protein